MRQLAVRNVLILLAALAATLPAFDLDAIRKEPNLERRSDQAMENASAALDRAREAYRAANSEEAAAAVDEVQASVDLAQKSLEESGKDARRSPKFFKKAELAARQMLRRIDGLKESLNFDERPRIEKLRDRVSEFHDELIKGIMGKQKR